MARARGVGFAGQRQRRWSDARDILGANVDHLRLVEQIIVAVGHAEAALEHDGDIASLLLVVLADRPPNRPADAVARRPWRSAPHSRALLRSAADLVRATAGTAPGPWPRPRPRRGSWRKRCRSCCRGPWPLLDDVAGALLRQVVELGEHAVVRLVGGDRRVLRPGAVGELVEIVARQDARSMPAVSKPKCRSRLGRGRAAAASTLRRSRRLAPAAAPRLRGAAGKRGPGEQRAIKTDHHVTPHRFASPDDARVSPRLRRAAAICARSTSAIRPATRYIRQTRLPAAITARPDTIAGAASDNSQASQRPTLAWVEAKHLECRQIGVEAEAVADVRSAATMKKGVVAGLRQEGHRRGDRDVGAERQPTSAPRRRSAAPGPSGKCRRTGRPRPRAAPIGG